MSNSIVPVIDQAKSPFDSIRRYRADGSEYWLGRELMALFAYSRWENFGASVSKSLSVIQKAIISTKASRTYTESCFRYITKTSPMPNGGVKESEDCELTRYAAYMTAMNGDVSKPEVAAAQSYFATKAREAEVVIPKQNDQLREFELRVQLAEAERDAAIAQKVLIDKREAINQFHAPTAVALILGATIITDKTPVERTITSDGRVFDGVGITAISTKLGFGKNTKACWQWLDSIGYGKSSSHWEEQLSAVVNHKLNPDAYDEILNKWNSGTRQRFIGE